MITVVVGIIIESGNILLCQRKKTSRYGLKWEFPGGKSEPDEPLETCLRRELQEELAIDAQVGELFFRQEYEYADSGNFNVFYYFVPSYTGAIQNRVFETTEWVPMRRLMEYDLLEGNIEIARKLSSLPDEAKSVPK